jgi:excinuclease ABC subunit B
LERSAKYVKKQMEIAAKDLDFIEAARLRDELFVLQKQIKEQK